MCLFQGIKIIDKNNNGYILKFNDKIDTTKETL